MPAEKFGTRFGGVSLELEFEWRLLQPEIELLGGDDLVH